MVTQDSIADKLIECDIRIKALEDLKSRCNNPEGVQMLIDDVKARKNKLLNSKN